MRRNGKPLAKALLAALALPLLVSCWALPAWAQEPNPQTWVVVGAQVADGTGGALRQVNVRIAGDHIKRVGTFRPRRNEAIVRGDGLVLAPGFIDMHNHSTEGLASDPLAESQISQGITTVVLGADGESPWPIADYLDARRKEPPALNLALLVGHATVRHKVMGEDYRRAARPEEIAKMERMVEQGMRDGAVGLSSGLEYEVGSYSTTEEVVALARIAARYGGFYMTHIRDEADRSFEAFGEAIAIGEQAHIPVEISHIKLGTVGVWGKAQQAVELIEQARRRGVDITADCYPYQAWHSSIKVLVPNKRYDDPASVEKALADVGGAANVMIEKCQIQAEYEFRNLEEIAHEKHLTPVELYIQIVKEGDASVIGKSMIEPDVRTFYQQPWVMVASDGGIGMRHPRATGTFPRVLGRYQRELHWLTLPEAVRKMASLPAARLRLRDRGVIRKGMKADLVLFDPAAVIDRSTFAEPQKLSAGIAKVYVNGELVWDTDKATGARPGRVLAREQSSRR